MKVYDNILETIGNTPLVRLHKIEKEYNIENRLYAKLESFNPSNSVKTRPAYFMIKDLYEREIMDHDTTIIEATSGNTGIGLSMVGAYFGNKVILTMPDTLSKERIDFMKMYGAKIILTDGTLGINGSRDKAEELNKTIKNSVIPSQFSNHMNPRAHFETTAVEIDTALDHEVDYIFAGIGTGGTITGLGMYFKEKGYATKLIGIEPYGSRVITENIKGKHKIQGIGAGFIPDILNLNFVDEVITVKDEEAFEMTKKLPLLEGISGGISAGAALIATINYLKSKKITNKNIVVIFPDSGEKYFSTDVFE